MAETSVIDAGYRFDHPTVGIVLRDMRIPRTDPAPGDVIPNFSVTTTDGITIDNASLRRDGRPALIVFGSLTCPVTESAGDGLRELAHRYGDRVRFILINVREAHPGASTPQPQTGRQKAEHAARLKEHHRLPFEVAADDLDGTLHRAVGPRPSSAYLVDPSGRIIFRAQWSNVTPAIEEAVAAAAAGLRPPRPEVGHTLRAMASMTGYAGQAFATAGRGASLDTWKVAPPFAAMIAFSKLFGFLAPRRRGAAAMITMAALMTVVGVAITALM
ncbi:alkyl hydroperoxide reductase/ Thiol specific antioxidant/ Mal allergen [Mycolicibacterium rhodesiae JS60]|nr:alkyl hydroperoxide reductase/ Thiol specific antioxidant/ Mal allergen [Mycolicibacterium rhodesiae JS60]